MRDFSQREFWIFVMTVMHTEQTAKSLTRDQRVAIEESIRKQNCPDIDYPEWEEIELNIVKNREKIISGFMSMFPAALGKKQPVNGEIDILQMLDGKFRETVKKIDFDYLKNCLPNDQSDETKRALEFIKEVEQLKKDMETR